jgi:hypothetical protein
MIRRYFGDRHASESMVNWTEVAWAGLGRLHQQLNETPFDEELRDLVALAETAVAGPPRPAAPGPELVVCPWFRVDDSVIKTIGRVARFDAAADVTLDELRIEPTYPRMRPPSASSRNRTRPTSRPGRAGRPLGVADDLAWPAWSRVLEV